MSAWIAPSLNVLHVQPPTLPSFDSGAHPFDQRSKGRRLLIDANNLT
jgi:hypothetical protein